jgi:hypothetical protein
MTKITKQFMAAFAVVGGLAVASSAMAQGVTGPQYLSNMDPANVQFFNLWQTPPATVTQTGTGLEINSIGGAGTFSTSYYALPGNQIQLNNPLWSQVTFSYIWNSGVALGGVNVIFSLDDTGAGGAADYYGTGYVIPQAGVNTFSFFLQPGNLADFQAGQTVGGINFQIDPANVSGNYDITYSSIILQTPEPSTFALAGVGTACLVIFRKRK